MLTIKTPAGIKFDIEMKQYNKCYIFQCFKETFPFDLNDLFVTTNEQNKQTRISFMKLKQPLYKTGPVVWGSLSKTINRITKSYSL